MTQTEALKLALEALYCASRIMDATAQERQDNAITAIKEALAQPEQEPVAWPCVIETADFEEDTVTLKMQSKDYSVGVGLHWLSTTPPQRTAAESEGTKAWVGLTDEMVVAAARVLNERQADACGVDRDDQWAIYSDDFKADALAMLKVAYGILEKK